MYRATSGGEVFGSRDDGPGARQARPSTNTVQRFGGSLTTTVTVFSIKVPTILSLVANDPTLANNGFGAGDIMTLTFSEPVNRAAGEVLTSNDLDDLLVYRVGGVDTGEPLATDYDAVFESPSRLRINIITPSSFEPLVGTVDFFSVCSRWSPIGPGGR